MVLIGALISGLANDKGMTGVGEPNANLDSWVSSAQGRRRKLSEGIWLEQLGSLCDWIG